MKVLVAITLLLGAVILTALPKKTQMTHIEQASEARTIKPVETDKVVQLTQVDFEIDDRLQKIHRQEDVLDIIDELDQTFEVKELLARLNSGDATQEDEELFRRYHDYRVIAYQHLLELQMYELEESVL
jgi:hypothetical protein